MSVMRRWPEWRSTTRPTAAAGCGSPVLAQPGPSPPQPHRSTFSKIAELNESSIYPIIVTSGKVSLGGRRVDNWLPGTASEHSTPGKTQTAWHMLLIFFADMMTVHEVL